MENANIKEAIKMLGELRDYNDSAEHDDYITQIIALLKSSTEQQAKRQPSKRKFQDVDCSTCRHYNEIGIGECIGCFKQVPYEHYECYIISE